MENSDTMETRVKTGGGIAQMFEMCSCAAMYAWIFSQIYEQSLSFDLCQLVEYAKQRE